MDRDEAIKCKYCGAEIKTPADVALKEKAVPDECKEKNWAVLSHLGGLIPVAFLSVIIPLLVWLFKGSDSAFVEKQSKEALNFQVSLIIYLMVAVSIAFTIIGIPIAIGTFIFFWLTNLICSLKGAVRTSRGRTYTYPFNLRLVH